jgi:hypothetical protein
MSDLSELGDTFVVLGVTQVMLFNGDSSVELLLLDTLTGEDFTIPVVEEVAAALLARRSNLHRPEQEVDERHTQPARGTSADDVSDGRVVRSVGGDALEADQF